MDDPTPEPAMQLTLHAEVAEIRRLADAIEAFGTMHGLSERIIGHFMLASDELVTNIILYSGSAPAAGRALQIDIEMGIADGRFFMKISDNGRPFDPFSVPPADLTSPLAERRVGGLGVHIVRTLMDDVGYSCQAGHNLTTITKMIYSQGSQP